jgi:hypothetical protein
MGIENQDAWLRASGTWGSLIVVCDGLGSKPHARMGAKGACLAVREAVVRWSRIEKAPLNYLAELIEPLWKLRISPYKPEEAATTCLIALARNNGEWVIGGIGDGLAAVQTGEQSFSTVASCNVKDFSNETVALGVYASSRYWNLHSLPATGHTRSAVLATDGISEDIYPDKVHGFCNWIVNDFYSLGSHERYGRLFSILTKWPTSKHSDDKTIAVLRVSPINNKVAEEG